MSFSGGSCEQVANTADGFLSQLEKTLGTVTGAQDQFSEYMKQYLEQALNPGGIDYDAIIGAIDGQISSGVDGILNTVQDYTGDCLNAILGPLQGMADDILGFGQSIIGEIEKGIGGVIGTITGALGSFLGFDSLMNGLGIGDLVSVLDNLMGCLSTASCIPYIGQVDRIGKQVSSLLKQFGLTNSGTFDIAHWFSEKWDTLTNLPTKIVDAIKNGITGLADKFQNILDGFKDKINGILDSFKNFTTTGITGVLSNLGALGGAVSGVLGMFGIGGKKSADPGRAGVHDIWDHMKITAKKKHYN